MNKKRILQIILAGTTFSSGMALAEKKVEATEVTQKSNVVSIESYSEANESYSGVVINVDTNLRVREEGSLNSKVLGYLSKGAKVEIKGESEEFYRITYNNREAYVSKQYVEVQTPIIKSRAAQKGKVVNTNGATLNVRQAPSTTATRIGSLKEGEIVTLVSKSGEWYNVTYGNKTGYVHGKYISVVSGGGSSSNVEKGQVVKMDSNLRVRQSPSTSALTLGYLTSGQTVEITGESGSWYKINFKGKVGYSHKDYIKKISSGSTVEEKSGVVNATAGLRVRAGASTSSSILGTLEHGKKVTIVGTSGSFYKIKYNNGYGYVHSDYVLVKTDGNNDSDTSKPEVVDKKVGEVYNTGSNLRVRKGPSTSTVVLGYLVDGSKVEIIGEEGSFYKINYKNSTGYVSKDYVKLVNEESKPVDPEIPTPPPVEPEIPTPPPTEPEGPDENKPPIIEEDASLLEVIKIGSVNTSSLNVRSGAGTDNTIIGNLSLNDFAFIVGYEDGWFKINYNNKVGYVSTKYISVATDYSDYAYSLSTFVNSQSAKLNMVQVNGVWVNANLAQIEYYMNPENFLKSDSKYMFMKLNYVDGIPRSVIDEVIQGRGILSGKGQAFLDGSKKYNVNIMYLMSHARLETGNGTSKLSTGVVVSEVDGVAVEPKVVYNMYGVGAVDSNPLKGGSEYAYKQGWFTPELAIAEGASWISKNYINSTKWNQNTLYKMRWNLGDSAVGWHQYATDIAWAKKQADIIAPYLKKCNVAFEFDIPTFK